MTKYKIEKGVPMISTLPHGNRDPNSFMGTLRRMEVGDSFFAEGKTTMAAGAAARVIRQRDGGNARYASRTVEGGVRIWRIF